MAQHYHCCPDECGDATLAMQQTIVGLLGAIATQIDDIDGSGGGSATDTKQDLILDEVRKLTGGLTTG